MNMDEHAFIADASISIFGALGAITVLLNLRHITRTDAVARHFRFCLWLLIILMFARVGHWGQLGWPLSVVTNGAAAFIPLAALLISEVLLRRHSPSVLKWFCGGGAVIFMFASLLTMGTLGFWHILGLLVFQLAGLGGVAAFVWTCDRSSLSMAENQAVGRIAMSFFLILPFVVSDFLRTPHFDIPVRMGGVAVLALCWLAISFQRPGLRKTDILRGFSAILVISIVLTALLASATEIDWRASIQITAVLVAALLLLATWQASVALHIEDGHVMIMRAMAETTVTGSDAGFSLLRHATGSPDAVLVEEAELADFDIQKLSQAFGSSNFRHKEDSTNPDDISWLLSSYVATHAIRLTDEPLTLVLLNNPAFAAVDSDEAGLQAAVRMARLISAKHAS